MKIKTTALAVLALGLGMAYTGSVFAQACGAMTGNVAAAGSFAGNNCGNNTNFLAICGNGDSLGGGGMDVWSMPIGASYSSVTISINTSAFTPELAVIGSPCSSNTACIIDQTVASAGNIGPIAFPASQPAGTYYIFVANVADAACGAYNLVVAGTLPVKLQKFSVN
jgi:hypothetical protein